MNRVSQVIIWMAVAALVLCFCTPPSHVVPGTATIPVINERVYLSPLISQVQVEKLPGWPQDMERQILLLRNFSKLGQGLTAEFRRCEKLGNYRMVTDAEGPTVRISVTLLPCDFTDDTLRIPFRLEAERLPDGQRYVYTLSAMASVPHHVKSSDRFHHLDHLFSQYRRSFPYRAVVSFFYPHEEDLFRARD